jgi:HK97 family phage prohead protease
MKPELKRIYGEIKAVTLDQGTAGSLEGYANVLGVIDSYGERTMPGAFAQDINEFLQKGYLAVDHEWEFSDGAIGIITEAREDGTGLYFKADFHSDPASQAIRVKVAERLAAGKEVGLSIGYWVMEADTVTENGETIRELKRLLVKEVSVVFAQANQPSTVTMAKSERKDAYLSLTEAVEGYASRVKEINDLGRSPAWKQERADELLTLAQMLTEAADSLGTKEESDNTDEEESLAALALLEAALIGAR